MIREITFSEALQRINALWQPTPKLCSKVWIDDMILPDRRGRLFPDGSEIWLDMREYYLPALLKMDICPECKRRCPSTTPVCCRGHEAYRAIGYWHGHEYCNTTRKGRIKHYRWRYYPTCGSPRHCDYPACFLRDCRYPHCDEAECWRDACYHPGVNTPDPGNMVTTHAVEPCYGLTHKALCESKSARGEPRCTWPNELHPALCFDCQVLHDEKRFLARFRVFARTAATSDFKAYLVHQVAQRCWPSAVTYSHLAAPATALAGGTVEQQPDTICYLSDEHGSATEGSAVYAEPDGPVTSDDRTWGDGGLNKSRAHLPQPKKQGSHRDKNRDLFCHVTLLSDTKATLEKEIQYFKSRYAALQDKLARLSAVGTPLSPKREYCELLRCYMPSSRRGHDAVGYLRPGVMKKIDRRQVQEMEAELKAHGVPRRQRPSIYANLQKTP